MSMAKKATSENKVEDVDLVLEVAAGGSSTKALDPCLETGEVGEGPARPAKEHLGRRGWMQCQSKEKGPRYSPGELNPGENVRVQDDKTKYWSKQAKVVKKLSARTYLLKSGSKMFKRNIRFIKAAPNAQDMDPPNITQAIKGENDCRPKVQGSNPTDDPMTRIRME